MADLPAIAEIYAHYVLGTVATFEMRTPDVAEWRRRFAAITAAGLPFLVAEEDGRVAGYAYCSPWKTRPAYRHTVENSIYLAPWALGRGLGGNLLDELLSACRARDLREVIAVIADTGDQSSPPCTAAAASPTRAAYATSATNTTAGSTPSSCN